MSNRKYTVEFKVNVIKMYLSGNYGGINKICEKFGFPSTAPFRNWLKKYMVSGVTGLENMTGRASHLNKGRPRINPLSQDEEVIKLKAENAYLKKLLSLERGDAKN